MGRESASYHLALTPASAEALVQSLDAAGVERRAGRLSPARTPRYWIDLRIRCGAQPELEIRIALTNDTWSIRAPLERALTPLPPGIEGTPVHAGPPGAGAVGTSHGAQGADVIAIAGEEGWWLALEDDYGRRRDEFVARVGDYCAPLSADHVYMYLHQTRWNQDNDDELAWHREREIARLEEAWDSGPEDPDENSAGAG